MSHYTALPIFEQCNDGGGRRATIPGTHLLDKMGCRYWKPVNTVEDVAVIKLPCDAPGRAPQSSIPYLWII